MMFLKLEIDFHLFSLKKLLIFSNKSWNNWNHRYYPAEACAGASAGRAARNPTRYSAVVTEFLKEKVAENFPISTHWYCWSLNQYQFSETLFPTRFRTTCSAATLWLEMCRWSVLTSGQQDEWTTGRVSTKILDDRRQRESQRRLFCIATHMNGIKHCATFSI